MSAEKKLPKVAYFCMEYGLESNLKMYAGGLGILAGDYLKGAGEMGLPMVAVGLKWKQGYGDQLIGRDGEIYDVYRNYRYPFLEDTNVYVNVRIRNRDIRCKVWRTEKFGNVPLYLLDTDLPENADKLITGQLYGWFEEERVAQEMVLGIGGVRALRALGIDVDIYHFNEGHAVFAGVELIREQMMNGATFENAWHNCRSKVVFTTHTPIIQGNESHNLERLFYMGANLGLSREQLVTIGDEPFNMTVAGLRLSHLSNAVSQLHMKTAREMWKHIQNASQIIGITNGIHHGTWVDEGIVRAAQSGNSADLERMHTSNKQKLLNFLRQRSGIIFDPDRLLVGFARRVVPYKRSDLLFRDESTIAPLLKSGKIQLLFAGKVHPQDDSGKESIKRLLSFAKEYPRSVAFVENYDMEIAAYLTKGVDVWLNNPRRPMEASGTSGMKAAMNGVLNLSVLDGWWAEACDDGKNGWQFGDGFESFDVGEQDYHDWQSLQDVLHNKVLPTYYHKRENWTEMMRNSVLSTYERFGIQRMLQEYYERFYCVEK